MADTRSRAVAQMAFRIARGFASYARYPCAEIREAETLPLRRPPGSPSSPGTFGARLRPGSDAFIHPSGSSLLINTFPRLALPKGAVRSAREGMNSGRDLDCFGTESLHQVLAIGLVYMNHVHVDRVVYLVEV